MEKFRRYGDAATGIHPFTFVIAPTRLGRVAAAIMFPVRLLFSAVFVLLLLLTDTILYGLYTLYLGLLGRLLLAPLQRLWIRGLLFFIGHILPEQPVSLTQANPTSDTKAVLSPSHVKAGDPIVCNLQSVWDGCVLEVMLRQPYHAVCFPDATTIDTAATSERAPAAYPGLRVFWPGPLQRWKVWKHARHTGSLDFLAAQHPDSASQQTLAKKAEELPLYRVQDAAAKAGVPVWFCGERTCTNGKGLLPLPPLICRAAYTKEKTNAATAAFGASRECAVYTATIQYDTPALQNVLGNDVEGVMATLYRASVLLYGSNNPNWSSPFFPHAEVTFRAAKLARATPYIAREEETMADKDTRSAAGTSTTYWTLTTAALQELRHAMCQRGHALVVSTSSSGGGVAVRRQPLSVGVHEKKGFVEAYVAMLKQNS